MNRGSTIGAMLHSLPAYGFYTIATAAESGRETDLRHSGTLPRLFTDPTTEHL